MRKAIVTGADTNLAITVQWDQCDSRAEFFTGAGWWKKLGSGSTKIQAFDTGSKAFTLDFSCSTKHQYRVHFTQGSNSGYVYYPEDTSQWTTVQPDRRGEVMLSPGWQRAQPRSYRGL